jgi:hypothetical protein
MIKPSAIYRRAIMMKGEKTVEFRASPVTGVRFRGNVRRLDRPHISRLYDR